MSSSPRSGSVTTASSAPVFSRSSLASVSIESREAGSMIFAKSLTRPSGLGQVRAAAGAAHASAPSARSRTAIAPLGADSARAIVRELEIKSEVLALERADNRLQIVAILPAHAHLVFLDRRLDPDPRPLDEFHDLLGLFGRDSLLDRDDLAHRSLGGGLDLAVLERLQGNASLHELGREHVDYRLEARLVVRVQGQHVPLQLDVAHAALEIEPLPDFLHRLLHGVRGLHHIDLGNNVERVSTRHRSSPPPRGRAAQEDGEASLGSALPRFVRTLLYAYCLRSDRAQVAPARRPLPHEAV